MFTTLLCLSTLASMSPLPKIATVVRVVDSAEPSSLDLAAYETAADLEVEWLVDASLLAASEETTRFKNEVRRCGDDNGCLTARMRQAEVDRTVYVVVNRSIDPGVVTVELLDAEKGGVVADALLEVGSKQYEGQISAAVASALAKAGHRRGGRLSVDVRPIDASLVLEPPAHSPVNVGEAITLDPGRYRIFASRDGYDDETAEVDVTVGLHATTSVVLNETPAFWTRWWFWTAVGVVAVGTVTAVIITRSEPVDVCHELGTTRC